MVRCDVIVVGGGPAGSSAAWRLTRAGFDVVLLDKAAFPREKVCAGWITPAVVDALAIDLEEYGRAHTLQAFHGFRTGTFEGPLRVTTFDRIVSWGIRRCEFDAYLAARSGATVRAGEPLRALDRKKDIWIANHAVAAPLVIGAGGHFCPVARQLRGRSAAPEVVVTAQEVEIRLTADQAAACATAGSTPDLFFWPDLSGYGWCVRKDDYLNVGVGRLGGTAFPAAVAEFMDMLARRQPLPNGVPATWKGHAYLLGPQSPRPLFGDGILLVGDAAGLALAPSGEGILSAVESGLLAADVAIQAAGRYESDDLRPYAEQVAARFGPRLTGEPTTGLAPRWIRRLAAHVVLNSKRLTRRVLVEDWFLHARRPPLTA
jgi:flavin-dependent dehydrogenase